MKNDRTVHGILLLNKALNITSNKALQQVKRLYRAKKAGHTGSLDPLATGVLPICFGEAAKFSQYLLDADKVYTVWGRLGCTTITGDAEAEAEMVPNAPVVLQSQFEQALVAFHGPIEQIPPMYSALKQEGIPLYELARKGIEVERKSRLIHISQIQLNAYTPDINQPTLADFQITVHCSKGTYIRTLVEDIAKSLHSGAYLLGLRRDEAGPFQLKDSFTFEQLSEMNSADALDALLCPPDTAVAHFPPCYLSDEQSKMLQQGKPVALSTIPLLPSVLSNESVEETNNLVRLFDPEKNFLGLGKILPDGFLRVQRLISF